VPGDDLVGVKLPRPAGWELQLVHRDINCSYTSEGSTTPLPESLRMPAARAL
jgi:hypothetical protein